MSARCRFRGVRGDGGVARWGIRRGGERKIGGRRVLDGREWLFGGLWGRFASWRMGVAGKQARMGRSFV
jgi:hypothetical protein